MVEKEGVVKMATKCLLSYNIVYTRKSTQNAVH
jgi:hypothetical protein